MREHGFTDLFALLTPWNIGHTCRSRVRPPHRSQLLDWRGWVACTTPLASNARIPPAPPPRLTCQCAYTCIIMSCHHQCVRATCAACPVHAGCACGQPSASLRGTPSRGVHSCHTSRHATLRPLCACLPRICPCAVPATSWCRSVPTLWVWKVRTAGGCVVGAGSCGLPH